MRPLFAGARPVSQGLSEVLGVLATADAVVANFEMPLTDQHRPIEKLLNIRGSPTLAPDVARLGFDVVTVANNHSVDHGWPGLRDTVACLGDAGLVAIGAGADRRAAADPWIRVIKGARVAVLPFSCLTPAGMAASDDRPGISAIHISTAYQVDALYQAEEPGDVSCVTVRTTVCPDDLEWALSRVSATAAEVDVVLVALHWGFGSGTDLAEYQQPLARALIDAGADAILGHHPHAIHGIGFHAGKPILYSPGTFIGQQKFLDASPQVKAMWAAMSTDAYVGELRLEDGTWSVGVTPITLDEDALPRVADRDGVERVAARLEQLSQPLGAAVRCSDDCIVATAQAVAHRGDDETNGER